MILFLILLLSLFSAMPALAATEENFATGRRTLIRAVLEADSAAQIEFVKALVNATDPLVERALAAWRVGELFIHEAEDGSRTPFLLEGQQDEDGRARGVRLDDGKFIEDADGQPLWFRGFDVIPADTTSRLRVEIRTVLDLFAMTNPEPRMRRDSIIKLGQQQNPEYLPYFELRLGLEKEAEVTKALDEAVALTRTVDPDPAIRNAAIRKLGEMNSINSLSFLKEMEKETHNGAREWTAESESALRAAIGRIESYIWRGTLVGTAFRGLSLAAVLLVAALGLAITFGLMGVINMAHGEMMAVGAYTAYVVQGLFGNGLMISPVGTTMTLKGLGLTGSALDFYFVVALMASFFTAAAVGLVLERGVIRFLYKRPLESLLATWGVSLVLQQLFRHTFGAANVQVDSPSWLSGSYVANDVLFAYNRLFVIGFAVFIVLGTWLLLTRTSLGLQIRAVMQNRAMASCMGVRTDRVNMLTFAFGSGLAGMAGACLSQIANVGPSLGQSYIVDCFMIVVLGGVGNLVGTVSAALGVGITDQILQPWLGAVMGKITVLAAVILFLQWRPAGIFVARSRSLEG